MKDREVAVKNEKQYKDKTFNFHRTVNLVINNDFVIGVQPEDTQEEIEEKTSALKREIDLIINDIKPQDSIEYMLLGHMIAYNSVAMASIFKAVKKRNPQHAQLYFKQHDSAYNGFIKALSGLMKYRSEKGDKGLVVNNLKVSDNAQVAICKIK